MINIRGKKGGTSDLFIFMIVAFTLILMCVIFIFLGNKVTSEVHSKLDNQMYGDKNSTEIIDQTLGKVNNAYQALVWIAWFEIIGMVIGIFIGSYLVTTKPVFFVPYIFIVIIAVIVAVALSNAYETLMQTEMLAETFAKFYVSNFIMLKLPIIISIIGFVGAIIMFARLGSGDNQLYGGYQQ